MPSTESLQKTSTRFYEGFGREYGHMGSNHECHSQSSSSSRKWSSWRTTGQLFGEKDKLISGQTETTGESLVDSKDSRWISTSLLHSRAYQCATAKVYVFLWLCAVFGKNWTRSGWVLEETSSVVFRNQLLQRAESNWWKTHGVRVEDLHRIHNSGHPQGDSENDGLITVWSSGLQRQDHLHVNVQRHCMGCKRKWWIMRQQFKDN